MKDKKTSVIFQTFFKEQVIVQVSALAEMTNGGSPQLTKIYSALLKGKVLNCYYYNLALMNSLSLRNFLNINGSIKNLFIGQNVLCSGICFFKIIKILFTLIK